MSTRHDKNARTIAQGVLRGLTTGFAPLAFGVLCKQVSLLGGEAFQSVGADLVKHAVDRLGRVLDAHGGGRWLGRRRGRCGRLGGRRPGRGHRRATDRKRQRRLGATTKARDAEEEPAGRQGAEVGDGKTLSLEHQTRRHNNDSEQRRNGPHPHPCRQRVERKLLVFCEPGPRVDQAEHGGQRAGHRRKRKDGRQDQRDKCRPDAGIEIERQEQPGPHAPLETGPQPQQQRRGEGQV
jgi:hypothetical protein